MRARVLAAIFAILCFTSTTAQAAGGDLDTAFSGDGKTQIAVGVGDAFPAAIVTRPTGEIVIAGSASAMANETDIGLAQLQADGTPDTAFGGGSGTVVTPISGYGVQTSAAVLQSDGKLVVVGTRTQLADRQLFLARYDATGALDPNFGTGGVATPTVLAGGRTEAGNVALTGDGHILVSARTRDTNAVGRVTVARFNSNGTIDTTWGAQSGFTALENAPDHNTILETALALQSTGDIVVGGTSSGADQDFRVGRLHADGSVDSSFGTGGATTVDFGNTVDELTSIAIRGDDKIDLGGQARADYFAVGQLDDDGTLDPDFGTGGTFSHELGDGAGARPNQLAVRRGRLYAGGYASQANPPPGITRGAIARYTGAGVQDPNWNGGSSQILTINGGKDTFVHALDTDPAHLLAAASASDGTTFHFGVGAFQYGVEPTPPANDTAPAITGTPNVGQTLTTDTGAWTPSSGLTFTYRWQVCASAGSTCASYQDTGDTTNSYLVDSTDEGKLVRVRVTATGDGGSTDAFATAVGPVVAFGTPTVTIAKPAAGQQVGLPETGPSTIRIEGSADTGAEATVHVELFTAANLTTPISTTDLPRDGTTGGFATDYTVPRADAAYHLVISHNGTSKAVDFTTDATAPTPTITAPAAGSSQPGLRVGFAGTLGSTGGDLPTLTLGLSGPITATPTAVVNGSQWTASLAQDLPQGSYQLSATQKDAVGHQRTVQSTFTVSYVAPTYSGPTPDITGTHAIGNTLTASPLTFGGTQPISLAYKWERCDGSLNCQVLAGQTTSTYLTTQADADQYLRLTLTATNAKGATPVEYNIAGPISRAGLGPKVIGTPTISGSPTVGATLTADASKVFSDNGSLKRTYQWQRCKDGGCADIGGATAQTYTIAAGDGGYRFRVGVVGTDALGSSPVQYSAATDIVPAGCQASVSFGPLTATGCFQAVGATYVGKGNVSLNGLHLDPSDGNAEIVIDPLNLRIATKGSAKIVIGPASLPGGLGTLKPVTLYEGHFDLVFQLNDQLKGLAKLAAGVALPQLPGAPHLDLPNLPGVGDLAAGLPKLSGLGLPDFSQLSGNALTKLRSAIPTWNLPSVAFPTNIVPKFTLPEIGLKLPGVPDLSGFPLDGSIGMRAIDGGFAIDAALKIPAFTLGIPVPPVTASTTVNVAANGTATVDNIKGTLGTFSLGPVTIEDFNLGYAPATDLWQGGATARLQPINKGLGGEFQFQHGKLAGGKLTTILGLPLGATGLFLDSLNLGYTTIPQPIISGGASITAGPVLPVINVAAATLTGGVAYAFASGALPGYLEFTGALALAKQKVADGWVRRMDTGEVKFHGGVDLTVPGSGTPPLGLKASLDGFFANPFWQVDGTADFTAKVFGVGGTLSGKARASDVGLAGCANVDTLFGTAHTGGGYHWSTHQFEWFGGSCGIAAYKSAGARRSASLFADSLTVDVPAGLSERAFSISGAGAAPALELDAPDGTKIATPPAGYAAVQSGRYYLIRDPGTGTVNINAVKPPAGTWTIKPLAGSVAITNVRSADPLPPVHVSARVHGHRLTYKVKPQPHMKVRFVEDAPNGQHLLGTAHGRRGVIRFTPAYGHAGTRAIEALVEQNGLPRENDVVTHYTAPGPVHLAAPRKLHLRRTGTKLHVNWKRVKGAAAYRVAVTDNGSSRSFDLSQHAFVLPEVWASRPVKVAIRALDPLRKEGAVARRSLHAKKLKPGRKVGGKKIKK